MNPALERIMKKVTAEHPHVPVPEVETPEVLLEPTTRVVITPVMRKEAAAHALQMEKSHPESTHSDL